jgi:hypothetical protein
MPYFQQTFRACGDQCPFFHRMYLSNSKLLTSLGCPLNKVFHVLLPYADSQDTETSLLSLLQIFIYVLSQLQCLRTCPRRRVT